MDLIAAQTLCRHPSLLQVTWHMGKPQHSVLRVCYLNISINSIDLGTPLWGVLCMFASAGSAYIKKPSRNIYWVLVYKSGDVLLSHGKPTLSSALTCFTSEFEMGSGGSQSLLSPEKLSKTALCRVLS